MWYLQLCSSFSRLFWLFGVFSVSILEKAMAPHSSTLAWKIPWMEEPGRLQSMGLLRVRHDWATSLSLSFSCTGEENGNPLQCSCLENSRDRGAWWAAIYGVAQSWTRLKRLSSSSQWVTWILTHSLTFPIFLYKSCIIMIFKSTNINRGQDYLW